MHFLRLCGAVALTTDDATSVSLGGKALALLSVLALEPRIHPREELATLLWGEYPDARAKASLRQALTRLREALGSTLRTDRSTVELTDPIGCDVTDFLRLARDDPWSAITIDVPRFLEGFAVHDCPAFEEWAEQQRLTLARRYREALAACTRDASARREWPETVRVAERWHDFEPLVDEPVAALMEAHFLFGDAHSARSTFAEYSSHLAAEGLDGPGRALVELAARIDRDAGSLPRAPLASDASRSGVPSFASSLIGRTIEWAQLREAWDATAQGESRIVVIEGEPGAGKTRLADDFVRWTASEGGIVLRGRAYDAQAGPSFGVMIEILGSAIEAPAIAGVAPEWLAEVARVVPSLRSRFPTLPDSSAGAPADSWRLFEAIAEVVIAIAEDDPVVILIDDLHRCDADSCNLLRYLVRRLGSEPVLWCATFSLGGCERDAPGAQLHRALRAVPGATSMVLGPLDPEAVWQLVRELGHVDAMNGGREFAGRLHEFTAGNPYYVLELLKTMFGEGTLTADAATGVWTVPEATLAEAADVMRLPAMHGAVAERIECLPDELREMLISVAVSGRGCDSEVLSHLHGISRLHAAARADALIERHLVDDDGGVYRCAHPVIATMVREGLSASRRREVHRAFALTLELLHNSPDGDDDDAAAEIARHAELAGERALAHKYALAAVPVTEG